MMPWASIVTGIGRCTNPIRLFDFDAKASERTSRLAWSNLAWLAWRGSRTFRAQPLRRIRRSYLRAKVHRNLAGSEFFWQLREVDHDVSPRLEILQDVAQHLPVGVAL